MLKARAFWAWSITCAFIISLAGCGGTQTAPTGGTELDPISQEIHETAVKKAGENPNIPPGMTMNSGGEIVPADEESDQ